MCGCLRGPITNLAYLRRITMQTMHFTTKTLDNFWKEYAPHAIGLDDVFTRLEAMSGNNINYPPYNLIKHDSTNFSIEIALAGFKSNEIEVSTESNILKVASKISPRDTQRNYLHKGLSNRSFVRTWQLSEDVVVRSVDYTDGLLTINLEKVVPESQKMKVYEIGSSPTDPKFLTEDRDSNFPNENTINN